MEPKGLLQSKTILGLLVTLAGMALGWSPDVQHAISADLFDGLDKVLQLAGLAWALYGRIKANTPVRPFGGKSAGGGGGTGTPAAACVLALVGLLALAGCSSSTRFVMTRQDGTTITASSAKQQSEEQAKWTIKVGADGSVNLDFGTKGTQPVNMTADTLQTILGLVAPPAVK